MKKTSSLDEDIIRNYEESDIEYILVLSDLSIFTRHKKIYNFYLKDEN